MLKHTIPWKGLIDMNSNEDFETYQAPRKEGDTFFWSVVTLSLFGIANLGLHVLLGSP
jgi:hypothetical protein